LEEVWSSPEKTRELLTEKSRLENTVAPFDVLENRLSYIEESIEILEEEGGEMFLKEIRKEVDALKGEVENLELQNLLSGDLDRNNAILTIHPGAGGTESQDWAQMLMRMYLRWAERHGYDAQIVDLQQGDEAGITGVTITFSGDYAYGYLCCEAGVHRLVRISPYDANKRRHTSFAAVIVYPEIEGDIDIEIREVLAYEVTHHIHIKIAKRIGQDHITTFYSIGMTTFHKLPELRGGCLDGFDVVSADSNIWHSILPEKSIDYRGLDVR
jgi:peptide chain release factor 2